MAWADAPSEGQMGAWWRLTKWALPDNVQTLAMDWLEKHADRKQMSDELARVRKLYIKRNLDNVIVFDDKIWDGFAFKSSAKQANENARELLRKYMG